MFVGFDAFNGVVCAYIEPALNLFKNFGVYGSWVNTYKGAGLSAQRALDFFKPRMLFNLSN
jgi:hypothetical protein